VIGFNLKSIVKRRFPGAAASVLVAALSLLPACGGAGGGIDGTGFVAGPIEGFGSLIVAGVTLETTEAAIRIDGVPVLITDLRLGMVVEVQGEIDRATATGRAFDIAFERDIAGVVTALDIAGKTFEVLGQRVRILSTTEFDDGRFEDLQIGSNVVVSGLRDATGVLIATFVGIEENEVEIELRGIVRDLNSNARTFRIGNQQVDFNGALVSGGPLTNGVLVEVESTRGIVGGTLLADSIEVEDDRPIDVGDEVEFEGFVTRVISSTEFELSESLILRILAGTEFSGGTRVDLRLNSFVQIEGTVANDGAVAAKQVEFKDAEDDIDDEDDEDDE
jgi:hypothetical protein